MHLHIAAAGLYALTATPAPSPAGDGLRPGLNADQVTPGFLGFAMTAFMVIAVVMLMVSMTRRIRRVRYREQFAQDSEAASARTDEARNEPLISPAARAGAAEPAHTADPGGERPRRD
ncbi:hypothetical protein LFT44_08330 [Arthrobacter sp. FW306-05-C]|uniref:hypothetical protein n=1 Tax=Arthrobacter sp. FW306-05-C TaxID=2879620 RepID=UPI001F2C2D81|nr:hypothetical protein [Arthrobacter sp. FW306-05-C]UKA68378.1 hypothetical protein LFT44_08330 [Arthrobacter sp. FW306-05-C]